MSTEQLDNLAVLFRRLPTELQLMILHYVTLLEHTCVFQSFPGSWNVCRPKRKGKESKLLGILRSSRTDTYRVSAEGRGTISTSFGHMDKQLDDIFLPLRTGEYDDIDRIQGISEYELWKLHHRHNIIQLQAEPRHIGWRLDDANFAHIVNSACLLRSEWAIENLPFSDTPAWANTMCTSRDDGEPQVYPLVRHLMFHTDEKYAALDSNDFYYPAYYWNQEAMTNSESYGAVGTHILERAAREMTESPAVRLRLLVLAGLRSGHHYPDPDELSIEEVEDYEPEKGFDPELRERRPEPNWFKLFRGAVRPGGELILIDTEGRVRKPRAELAIELWPGHRAVFRANRPNPWALYDSQLFGPTLETVDLQKWRSRTRGVLFTEEATALPPHAAVSNIVHESGCSGDSEDITMAFSPW